PLSAVTFFDLPSKYSAKQSPPIPVEAGSVTFRTAAVATAASAAFPPSRKIASPACAAGGLLVATIPRRARTIERRERNVSVVGFILVFTLLRVPTLPLFDCLLADDLKGGIA